MTGPVLRGDWRDRMFDGGRVIHDSGVRKNVIVDDCRRLLASFMRGTPATTALTGLQVGAGDPAWDAAPPVASAAQSQLVDPAPFTVPAAELQFDFLDGEAVSAAPTNVLRITATLAPGEPPWPDAQHPTANLREFGLIAELDGSTILIDYIIHPVIAKGPAAPLERTIWLTF